MSDIFLMKKKNAICFCFVFFDPLPSPSQFPILLESEVVDNNEQTNIIKIKQKNRKAS